MFCYGRHRGWVGGGGASSPGFVVMVLVLVTILLCGAWCEFENYNERAAEKLKVRARCNPAKRVHPPPTPTRALDGESPASPPRPE